MKSVLHRCIETKEIIYKCIPFSSMKCLNDNIRSFYLIDFLNEVYNETAGG